MSRESKKGGEKEKKNLSNNERGMNWSERKEKAPENKITEFLERSVKESRGLSKKKGHSNANQNVRRIDRAIHKLREEKRPNLRSTDSDSVSSVLASPGR